MKVFVTGGSGFVGGHAIEHLAKTHEVLAMARSDRSAEAVGRYGATAVRCDLDNVDVTHLRGCDAIVHCAAYAEEWGTREQFWKGNVEGTERMLRAAAEAGVGRFVHIGTEAALFDGTGDLLDVDETFPYPTRHRYLYPETKAAAEQRVLAASTPTFAALSVRPRLVWGPRDTSVLPVIRRMAADGSFAWLDGGRHKTSVTHVANLAHALGLALERGRGGEVYFVADDEVHTARSFLEAVAGASGFTLPARSIPGWLARPLAHAVEGTWRALGIARQPPMTGFAVSMMSRSVTVRTDKAKRELGYAPVVDFRHGLDTLRAAAGHTGAEAG